MGNEAELLLKKRDLLVEQQKLLEQQASHVQQAVKEPSFTRTIYKPFDMDLHEEFGRQVAEPINRMNLGILDLPVNLVNAGISALYAADKKVSELFGGITENRSENPPQLTPQFTALGEQAGVIEKPEFQRHGLVPEVSAFVGGGIGPMAGILAKGYKTLASPMISPTPTILQNMGRVAAANPIKATAFDVAANASAASGGEIARNFTEDPTIIALSQLGAAFVPTSIALLPGLAAKYTMMGKLADKTLEVLGPYTEAGAKAGASNRIQGVSEDSVLAASRLDPNSPLPIALQTQDKNIIKLQEMVLKRHPALAKKYSDELQLAIEQLTKEGNFGGDAQRVRHLLNVRGQMAVEEASLALAKLNPNATPRQISDTVKPFIQKALDDAVKVERVVWEKLDSSAPGKIDNAQASYADEIARRSPKSDPSDIPAWVATEFGEDATKNALTKSLSKDGWVGVDGEISPALLAALEKDGVATAQEFTFNEIKALRTRLGTAITKERGKPGFNRNKVRIMSRLRDSLLDDLLATKVAGTEDAIAYSRALNDRYRKGDVGKLLGYDITGAEKVSSLDLLNDVVFGRHSATNTQYLIEMANEAPEATMNFLRSKYIQTVYKSNYTNPAREFNQRAHESFVENLRNDGMFEVFPNLEAELHTMRTKGLEALKLDVPNAQIGSSTQLENRSRASLLLQAKVGDEMAAILDSAQPVLTARSVMKRLHGQEWPNPQPDPAARQGVKTAFFQEILKRSASSTDVVGRVVPNGERALAYLESYKDVMTAIGMTEAEKARAIFLADQIRIGQLTGAGHADIGTTIMAGGLAKPIELAARVLGARTGSLVAQGSPGGAIQLAGVFSKESRDRILNLTTSRAEELIVAAFDDRELMNALLLGPRAGTEAQRRASKVIENAIRQSEINGAVALETASQLGQEKE